MNKKLMSLGMVLPLAAAGAVATAPAASASSWDRSSVKCELSAWRDNGSIRLKLEVNSRGDQGKKFHVRIRQNGDTILHRTEWDRDGDFTVRKHAKNKKGTDYFSAYVRNAKTGDDDTCRVKVTRGHK
jgi:hypothetical protein